MTSVFEQPNYCLNFSPETLIQVLLGTENSGLLRFQMRLEVPPGDKIDNIM